MNGTFDQCAGHVDELALEMQDMRDMLQGHAWALRKIKSDLRA